MIIFLMGLLGNRTCQNFCNSEINASVCAATYSAQSDVLERVVQHLILKCVPKKWRGNYQQCREIT